MTEGEADSGLRRGEFPGSLFGTLLRAIQALAKRRALCDNAASKRLEGKKDMPQTVDLIREAGDKVISGQHITLEEAHRLIALESPADIHHLIAQANRIRAEFHGDRIDLCAIVNAKSGRCSENCGFCAQSSHFKTEAAIYPLMTHEEIMDAGNKAVDAGAYRFSIVTSGKGVINRSDMDAIVREVEELTRMGIRVCASLGLLSDETALALKQAGLERYHHNLETSRSHYPSICTTHDFQDRVDTVYTAHRAGLEVCCGGILGLGESRKQRVELAFEIKDLPVRSIPINILNPIPGTPLGDQPPLEPLEVLKTIAVFRFILPDREIRTCGGREMNLRGLQPLMFTAGCTGTMIGNYLTTEGRNPEQDIRDIEDLGLTIAR